jgi:hypothetical protein
MWIDDNGHVHVYENTWDNASDYATYFGPYTYWTNFRTQDNKLVFIVQGSVNLIDDPAPPAVPIPTTVRDRFVGLSAQPRDAWLHIHLSLPNVPGIYSPPGLKWQHEAATPFVTINGVNKEGDNHDGGWQVYNFGVEKDIELYSGGHDSSLHDVYAIWSHWGLRGAAFRLTRVGFTLTLTGSVTS